MFFLFLPFCCLFKRKLKRNRTSNEEKNQNKKTFLLKDLQGLKKKRENKKKVHVIFAFFDSVEGIVKKILRQRKSQDNIILMPSCFDSLFRLHSKGLLILSLQLKDLQCSCYTTTVRTHFLDYCQDTLSWLMGKKIECQEMILRFTCREIEKWESVTRMDFEKQDLIFIMKDKDLLRLSWCFSRKQVYTLCSLRALIPVKHSNEIAMIGRQCSFRFSRKHSVQRDWDWDSCSSWLPVVKIPCDCCLWREIYSSIVFSLPKKSLTDEESLESL